MYQLLRGLDSLYRHGVVCQLRTSFSEAFAWPRSAHLCDLCKYSVSRYIGTSSLQTCLWTRGCIP